MTTTTVPAHLLPTSCFVCGGGDHGATFTETGKGHNFWSNAEAKAEFAAEDRRTVATYSDGTTTPEAHYVAEYRPY